MSFNTLGSRDDTSLKLRSQNQQVLSKEQTKLLEMETAKMAERLMELKIAMSREKEEREKTFRGGGFWHSGQAGSLGSYPKEVLSKPMKPREQNSGKKITWLKNEPIVLPERARGPCTMSAIADRKLSSDKGSSAKFKGRRCGQCEEKAAHVNCTECGEDYCAACFTAFHLKGALKKHRSTPIGSGGLRTPRADVKRIPKDDYKENIQHASGDGRNEKVTTSTVTDSDMRRTGNITRSDSREVSGKSTVSAAVQRQGNVTEGGGSLLDGTYDPVENQKQFEEALREWRLGGKTIKDEETKPVKAKTPRAADVSVETATDGILRQPVDIKFSSQSLSYAERLMLKKHRRMELGALPGATANATNNNNNSSSSRPSSSASASAADEALLSDRLRQSLDANVFQRERAGAVAEDGKRTRLSDGDSESRSHREILDGFLSSSRSQVKDSVAVVADSSRLKNDLGKMHPANRKASSARMSSERQKVAPAATRIRPAESKLSIVELTKPMSKRDVIGLERSTTYSVIEMPDPISERTMPKQLAFRRISARPKIRKDAFSSPSGSLDLGIQPRPPRKPLLVTQTSVEAFDAPRRVLSGSKDAPRRVMSGSKDASQRVMSGSKDASQRVMSGSKDAPRVMSGSKDASRVSVKDSLNCKLKSEGVSSSQSSLTASRTSLNSAAEISIVAKQVSHSSKQTSGKDDVVLEESVGVVEKVTQSRISSRVGKKVPGSRTASKLGGRLKEEGGEVDEPSSEKAENSLKKSRAASRPGSQMTSRQGKRPKSQAGSRPASRLATHRDGLLTKVPSEALRDVARLADASSATSQQMDLGAYFTMEVQSDHHREVMTPVSSRPNSAHPNGRWKVSNTLYQMGPRSWKPDTSLVETVSEGQARQNVAEAERLTTEPAKEPSSLPQSSFSSSTLKWSLSHGLSSADPPDKFNSRVTDQTVEPSGGKSKTSDLEISRGKKSGRSEVTSESKIGSKVLSKEEDDALKEMKLNFVQGNSVTPNMMIPTRFRRPGSGNTGRESQCGSRIGRESQCGSKTERESQCGSRTGRESQCGSRTGRESQMIVYDGDELSSYDEQDFVEQQRENDAEAMKRLDLEIASETGLMAADVNGKRSKQKLKDNGHIVDLSMSSNENFATKFHKLRESQLMCDFDEMEAKIMEDYEEEVKALK